MASLPRRTLHTLPALYHLSIQTQPAGYTRWNEQSAFVSLKRPLPPSILPPTAPSSAMLGRVC